MTPTARWMGVLVGCGFVAVSIFINLRFGAKLGSNGVEQYAFIGISVLADVWKAIGLVYIAACLRRMMLVRAVAAGGIWLVCVVYSLTSALGFAAYNRAAMTGEISTRASELTGIGVERKRKAAQLEALGAYEAASLVEAKLAVEREKQDWKASKECADATTSRSGSEAQALR